MDCFTPVNLIGREGGKSKKTTGTNVEDKGEEKRGWEGRKRTEEWV